MLNIKEMKGKQQKAQIYHLYYKLTFLLNQSLIILYPYQKLFHKFVNIKRQKNMKILMEENDIHIFQ